MLTGTQTRFLNSGSEDAQIFVSNGTYRNRDSFTEEPNVMQAWKAGLVDKID